MCSRLKQKSPLWRESSDVTCSHMPTLQSPNFALMDTPMQGTQKRDYLHTKRTDEMIKRTWYSVHSEDNFYSQSTHVLVTRVVTNARQPTSMWGPNRG